MVIFRITLAIHAGNLHAPGLAGRWNPEGTFVIYASSSRSLACLENIVHRSSAQLGLRFRCMIIGFPDALPVETADIRAIGNNWFDQKSFRACQAVGDAWLRSGRTCILRVPSAVIRAEDNYVINAKHPDFSQIRITGTEEFLFDSRLK